MRVTRYGRWTIGDHLRQWWQWNLVITLQAHATTVRLEIVRFASPFTEALFRWESQLALFFFWGKEKKFLPLTISYRERCFESARLKANIRTGSKIHYWSQTTSLRSLCWAESWMQDIERKVNKFAQKMVFNSTEQWTFLHFYSPNLGHSVYIKSAAQKITGWKRLRFGHEI